MKKVLFLAAIAALCFVSCASAPEEPQPQPVVEAPVEKAPETPAPVEPAPEPVKAEPAKAEPKDSIDNYVTRSGNMLKISVPSVIFRKDNADFKTTAEAKNGIDGEEVKINEQTLNRVATILKKFSEYNVTIVGHANKNSDNEAEETTDNPRRWGCALIPLSEARAEYIKKRLVEKGISEDRLTTEGRGGSQPIVNWKDKKNNWKNRRVEFILSK